ncbi:MAG TPA: low temperature requirement protein A [Thermoleophilaceae bacterium]|nr:low temperature requirement protein A [Thermoleophilaceae bacterium]
MTTDAVAERGFTPEKQEEEQRVTPLELFFDLVFVFALTQVTALMSATPTWEGLLRGTLILSALWWAWGAYSWLTNYIDTEQVTERLLLFASMAAMLVAALAVPNAFEEDGVLFGCAYALVRWLHIFIFAEANDDVDAAGAIRRLARTALPAPAMLIAAGFIESDWQYVLWVLALTVDFAGPFVFGVRGFQVSAGHFAERFALIVIIALGESIVAIGVGAQGLELDAGMIAAAVLGIVLAAALWWAYFDVVALVSERHFRETRGYARSRMARDSYSYLHLPMIAGVILIALGVKKTLGDVDQPLKTVPAVALFGGIALYYAGHIGFRLRNVRTLNKQRLVTAVVCLALIPVATEVDALVAVAMAAAITSALIAYEAIHFREDRARVRAAH